mmetsp:Transcript_63829/g.143984  ORF Transcript_63829/g.143984 Transcript_63829/m.143984 type:complete len:84 (-) Transcript_63829:296-547(-)|eukprot:CAMPEP_0172582412 /NCGR_PEP_ID=MMETSP1068-20121228/1810_1 /TAXON_ID=35684 /ORGANISM="Pseudopedinella elastica, Strain CCMP716" /LENGTH=83 /DNA_ID=CAMNT_0013375747 /DNA_START=39 /DNA_END=290 /DNA_ORIENTATION=+
MYLRTVVAALVALPASAFQSVMPRGLALRDSVVREAHHVQKKGAKKHADRRPKKSRPSDINRKPTSYAEVAERPAQYTVLEEK